MFSQDSRTENANLRMRAELKPAQAVWIFVPKEAGFKERFAARELARGLRNLGLAHDPTPAPVGAAEPALTDLVFTLTVSREISKHPEGYEIAQAPQAGSSARVRLSGATPQALLYAVFDFLERQGAFFGLDGEIYPPEPARALNLPPPNQPWQVQPRFNARGLVPWPDFLNCITVFNREDHRAYLEAMVRMRFNSLGIHVYSGANQWAESFLSFEYGPVGRGDNHCCRFEGTGRSGDRRSHSGSRGDKKRDAACFRSKCRAQRRGGRISR